MATEQTVQTQVQEPIAEPIAEPKISPITDHPEYTSVMNKIRSDTYNSTKARLLKEFGFKNETEAKEKIAKLNLDDLSDTADHADDQIIDDKKDSAQDIKKLNTQIKGLATQLQKEREKNKLEQNKYNQKIIGDSIANSYLKLGGLPDSGEAKYSEQVRKLILSEHNFSVTDDYQTLTESGLTVDDAVKGFLEKYPAFKINQPNKLPSVTVPLQKSVSQNTDNDDLKKTYSKLLGFS